MKRVSDSQPIIIARGNSERALEQLAGVLQEAEIPFDVQEEVGADSAGHNWRWAVRVRRVDLERARRALAREPELHTSAPPPRGPDVSPKPLFESRGPEALRVLLVFLAFGLAVALFFRDCVT